MDRRKEPEVGALASHLLLLKMAGVRCAVWPNKGAFAVHLAMFHFTLKVDPDIKLILMQDAIRYFGCLFFARQRCGTDVCGTWRGGMVCRRGRP